MTTPAHVDPERIAVAIRGAAHVARLDGGPFGVIASYLPGRRVLGVSVRPDAITVGVVGRYPATIAEIDAAVRAAIGQQDRPVHVTISDLVIAERPAPAPRTGSGAGRAPRRITKSRRESR